MSTQIDISQSGRVLTARLNNPPHNFMTTQMVRELEALVARSETDDSVGAVVLTGATPEVFISHFDVGEIAEGGDEIGKQLSPGAARHVMRLVRVLRRVPGLSSRLDRSELGGVANLMRMHEVFARMERSPAVFIAAINGRAMGGGFELALACDLRLIAQDNAALCLPEMVHGLIPGGGGTQRLTRALGEARARSLILTARPIGPDEAQALGLVEAVVANQELAQAADALARRMARRSRVSVRAAKQAICAAGTSGGVLAEQVGFLASASTPAANGALRQYHQRVQGIAPGVGALEREFDQWRSGERMDLTRKTA